MALKKDSISDGQPAKEPFQPPREWYWNILAGAQEQVRFADSKAAFLAGLNTLLFGFMVSNISKVSAALSIHEIRTVPGFVSLSLLLLYLIATTASLVLLIGSVMPRLGESAPLSKVFFGHIATHYGRRYDDYIRDTVGMSETDWTQAVGTQIVEVSNIALSKHKTVTRASKLTFLAVVLWMGSLAALATLPTTGA